MHAISDRTSFQLLGWVQIFLNHSVFWVCLRKIFSSTWMWRLFVFLQWQHRYRFGRTVSSKISWYKTEQSDVADNHGRLSCSDLRNLCLNIFCLIPNDAVASVCLCTNSYSMCMSCTFITHPLTSCFFHPVWEFGKVRVVEVTRIELCSL